MFLIFNLLRPNVLPLDDLGLLKAVSVNYLRRGRVTGKRAGRARIGAAGRNLGAVAQRGHVVSVAQP